MATLRVACALALLPSMVRAVRSNDEDLSTEEPPAHLARFAARGSNFEAWHANVLQNNRTEQRPSLLEREEVGVTWPSAWQGKLSGQYEVGEGAFGKVYVAATCNGPVAIKEMTAKDDTATKMINAEAKALKFFTPSPDFVAFFDEQAGEGSTRYIMMEAAMGKTLEHVIKYKVPAEREDRQRLFYQLLRGMHFMHSNGIVHRDLKPANLFVSKTCGTGTAPCSIKVGDLGLACSKTSSVTATAGVLKCGGLAGTPYYIAPELWLNEAHPDKFVGTENDMWALGLILYQIAFNGALPVNGRSMKQLKQSIVDYEPTIDRNILKAYPKKTDIPRKLLFCMLEHLPGKRCKVEQALAIAAPWNHNEGVRTVAGLPPCWSGAEAPATNAQHTQPLEPATITAPAKPMVIEPAKQISVQDESFDLETLAVEEMQWKNGNVKLQSPRTSSQVKFLFNPKLVHPTSGLIGSSGHLLEDNQKQNYFHKWLKRGYIVLEVAGLVWPLTEDEQEGVLSGLYNKDTDYIIVRYKKPVG